MPRPTSTGARPRFWTKVLAAEVGITLAIPLVLGATVGFFEINPVQGELLAPVGSEAHLLLDGFPDDSLVVEVAYQTTIGPPPPASISTLLDRINSTCQKTSVQLDLHSFTSGRSSFRDSDLLSLEEHVRQTWPTWGRMSLFYLYLGGSAAGDPAVIGEAYRGSSIAVFGGAIGGLTGAPSTGITTTVFVHEFGHELGLVGLDSAAPNEDPAHPYHSNNSSDVMYWAVDSTAISSISAPPNQFSAADLKDLQAVRSAIIFYEVLPWVVLAASALMAVAFVVHRRWAIPRAPDSDPERPA